MRQVYQQLSTYRNTNTPEAEQENESKTGGTFVSTQTHMNSSLTMQQRKEQTELMPAPLPVVSQSASAHKPSGSAVLEDEEQALEIDALTPSIDNYQPQVISETLQCDADLDVFNNQFLELATGNSTQPK